MFEIGNSLREARLRQGLDFARVETETKIRAKYVQALEDERFEVLPGDTYVKGFLRTYAEYLGLDGQLYVDEFNSRFVTAEEPVVPASVPRRPRPRAAESSFVVVALAGIVAVTVLVVVAFGFSNGPSSEPADLGGARPAGTGETTKTTGASKARTGAARRGPTTARLVLTAARGDCWVEVHAGSATGALLFSGTIERGTTMRFAKRRMWLALGAPSNVDATLNGKRVRNFPADGSTAVVVTAKGIRPQT